MNLVMMPMFVGSGVFFSSANFPDAVQPVLRALPLTALNDALRAVVNEGAGAAAIAPADPRPLGVRRRRSFAALSCSGGDGHPLPPACSARDVRGRA